MIRKLLSVCVLAATSMLAACAADPVSDEPFEASSADEALESILGEAPALEAQACTPNYCCAGNTCCSCSFDRQSGTNVCVCSALLPDNR